MNGNFPSRRIKLSYIELTLLMVSLQYILFQLETMRIPPYYSV